MWVQSGVVLSTVAVVFLGDVQTKTSGIVSKAVFSGAVDSKSEGSVPFSSDVLLAGYLNSGTERGSPRCGNLADENNRYVRHLPFNDLLGDFLDGFHQK